MNKIANNIKFSKMNLPPNKLIKLQNDILFS